MKLVKHADKKSLRRTLSLSSDSESSSESYYSNDSNKSHVKWAKRSKQKIGPVNTRSRKVPGVARIRNFTANNTPSLSTSSSAKSNYFDFTNESKEHSLLLGVSFTVLKDNSYISAMTLGGLKKLTIATVFTASARKAIAAKLCLAR